MSCTVIAIPYALAWVIGAVATAATATATAADAVHKKGYQALYDTQDNCEDIQTITTDFFIEKDFETPFVDKEILRKTLEEHGVVEIQENGTEITGTVDNYTLTFKKESEEMPYKLRIKCKEQDNAQEKLEDLGSEYAMNVQENAYLHIIDKLKENNMTIEEEVVEDDNTIVLTVNIE